MRIAPAVILALLTVAPGLSLAQENASLAELRAAKALDDMRGDPLALHDFLKRMPKGADLHVHLHGAVFAETLISEAIEASFALTKRRTPLPNHKVPVAMRRDARRAPYPPPRCCRSGRSITG